MRVFLEVNAPAKPAKRVEIKNDVLIGRGKTCNLRILSNEVSREHCRLLVRNDSVAVHDLGSSNGTQVNGHTITAKVDFVLESGAEIIIGPLRVVVSFDQPAGVATASARRPEKTQRRTSDKTVRASADAVAAAPATAPGTIPEPIENAAEFVSEAAEVPDFGADELAGSADEKLDDLAEFEDDEPVGADEIARGFPGVVEPAEDVQFSASPIPDFSPGVAAAPVEKPAAAETPEKKRSFFSFFRRDRKSDDVKPAVDATESRPIVAPAPVVTRGLIAAPGSFAETAESAANFSGDVSEDLDSDLVDDFEDENRDTAEAGLVAEAASVGAVEFDADAFFGEVVPSGPGVAEADVEEVDDAPSPNADVDPGFSDFLNQIGQ